MYAFALLAMPLSFFTITALTFRSGSASYTSYIKGLVAGIPSILIWLLLKPLFAPVWGSWLLVLTFLAKYWLLPFGLAAAAYEVTAGFRGLSRGGDYGKVTAFLFGVLSVFGTVYTIDSWGNPSRVYALVLPCLFVASALLFPVLLEEAAKDGFPTAVKQVLLALGAFVLAAAGAALFFMRLAWLGLLISLLYVAGAGILGWRRLSRPERVVRPEQPARLAAPAQSAVQPQTATQARQGRRTLPLKKPLL